MDSRSKPHRELTELLSALQDEHLSEKQAERLNELLLGDEQARRIYYQYVNMEATLSEYTIASANGDAVSQPQSQPQQQPRAAVPNNANRALWVAVWGLTALAASLMVVVLIQWRFLSNAGEANSETSGARMVSTQEPTDASIARLSKAIGVQWMAGSKPFAEGSPLFPGIIEVDEGIAQIDFYSGASVLVEGPAELELLSSMKARCIRGKLRVRVPEPASGFVVLTPETELVDLGTEFGMEVVEGEATDVVVFDGKVELYAVGQERDAGSRRQLSEGQSVRIDRTGEIAATTPTMQFPTSQELASQYARVQAERLALREESADKLRTDPDVLVYYTFESDTSVKLDNTAGLYEGLWDGLVIGGESRRGRWSGKHALQFTGVSDRVRVNVPGTFDGITLAAWVRIDRLPERYAGLLMSDGFEEGDVHWQIASDGSITLGVQGFEGKNGVNYQAASVIKRDDLSRWIHLAVVYDRAQGEVKHFVDGKQVQSVALGVDPPLRVGSAEIGNWYTEHHETGRPIRNFSGCIDELIVAGRAFTSAEMEELARIGSIH